MAQQAHFNLSVVTPPAVEPVTYTQAKKWLRVDFDDDQDVIQSLITAAREMTEEYCGRSWINQTLQMQMDRFPIMPNSQYAPGNPSVMTPVLQNTWPLDPSIWAVFLPRSPVSAVGSIQYYDGSSGNLLTLAPSGFLSDLTSEPARLSPAVGSYWPSVQWRPDAVTVQFTAGYGAGPSSIPQRAVNAMKMQVFQWYDYRSGSDEGLSPTVKAMLDQLKVEFVW